jgi:hypothetical protein
LKNVVFWDVTLVRNDVSEECIASIKVERISITAKVPISVILSILKMEAICSFETSIPTRLHTPPHPRRHSS